MSDTDDTKGAGADQLLWALRKLALDVHQAQEADPDDAAHGLMDEQVADALAGLQDARRRLMDVERALAGALGKRLGKTTGSLGDGRQFTLKRAADRKEWDHDDWKRDVRRELVTQALDGRPLVVTDTETGEEHGLGMLLHGVLANAQEVHGSTPPRSTALKGLGLFASDYCTSTPSGWTFSAVAPTEKKAEATADD